MGGAMSNANVRAYVGTRIKEFRGAYGEEGISQEALAAKMGVAANTISRWETGTYEPTLNDLEKLARFFGKSIVQFFPQVEAQDQRSQKVDALLRAAEALQQDDLDELRRYAEFRRARSLQKGTKQRKRS
jgi:transcriptional regulator with XRE-family HTH domain